MLSKPRATGDGIGIELEQAFFTKAKQAGLSDEEAKSAFNSNMMATGLLSEFPADFAREHRRRWLVSAYEAGDVVLHKPHMVRPQILPVAVGGYSCNPCRFTRRLSTMIRTMLFVLRQICASVILRSRMIK